MSRKSRSLPMPCRLGRVVCALAEQCRAAGRAPVACGFGSDPEDDVACRQGALQAGGRREPCVNVCWSNWPGRRSRSGRDLPGRFRRGASSRASVSKWRRCSASANGSAARPPTTSSWRLSAGPCAAICRNAVIRCRPAWQPQCRRRTRISCRAAITATRLNQHRVPLHVEVESGLARLRAIRQSAEDTRQTADVIGHDLLRQLADELPTRITSAVVDSLLGDYLNIVVSTVRGPEVPLYLAGAQLNRFYPIGVVKNGVGLNITGFSYCGNLWATVVSCRKMMPDPEVFASLPESELRCPGGRSRSRGTGRLARPTWLPTARARKRRAPAPAASQPRHRARRRIIRCGHGCPPRLLLSGMPEGDRDFCTRSPNVIHAVNRIGACCAIGGIESSQDICLGNE